MKSLALVIAVVAAASVLAASSPRERALQGSLEIRGATIIDPPEDEPKNTHAAFVIEGAAAKLLYDTIQAKPVEDECAGDGTLRKSAGKLSCYRRAEAGRYECDFAIDLKRQRIEAGLAC
jgi:hypothetical protein